MNDFEANTTIPDDHASWSDLKPEVKGLFQLAAQSWEDTDQATQYVEQALQQCDDIETLVSAYRFYFYKSQTSKAIEVANRVLDRLSRERNLPSSWNELKPILAGHQEDTTLRLYLAAYAAKSLLLAQLGNLEEAEEIAGQVKSIDPRREFCATTLHEVLTNRDDESD